MKGFVGGLLRFCYLVVGMAVILFIQMLIVALILDNTSLQEEHIKTLTLLMVVLTSVIFSAREYLNNESFFKTIIFMVGAFAVLGMFARNPGSISGFSKENLITYITIVISSIFGCYIMKKNFKNTLLKTKSV